MPVLLILGGSDSHQGGVEQFIERATGALLRRGGWTVEHLATNSAYLRLKTLWRFGLGLRSLIKRHRSVDCIWLQYGNVADLAFVVLARILGCQMLVTPHLGSHARSQASPVLRVLSARVIKLASRLALLSTSQEDELELSTVPKSYIRTFLPEASLESTDPMPVSDPDVKRLIHAGRLSEDKGSVLIVDVCARLRDADVPFQAEIIGSADPETLDKISKKIDEFGLRKHVSLLGYMPVPDLLRHLRQADVLIHLSRSDSYPLIVLEGMACSLLPICLDMAGARSMIDSYDGYVVGNPDPAGEAADIIKRIDVTEFRRRAQEASQRVKADFNWASSAEALDTALRHCITDRHPRRATYP